MAVFKATSYTKSRGAARASIRYIATRPGRDRQRLARQLFGADGAITGKQACRLIDEANRGAYFYRLVVSPDPSQEDGRRDLSLWAMTRTTMQTLEERFNHQIAWVAAEHNDHTPNRHVHVIAILNRRLRVQDLTLLRQSATRAALLQRQQLDLTLIVPRRRGLNTKPPIHKRSAGVLIRNGTRVTQRSSPIRSAPSTHNSFNRHLCTCPYCLTEHDKRLDTKSHRCHTCHRRLHEEQKITLVRGKSRGEAGWER